MREALVSPPNGANKKGQDVVKIRRGPFIVVLLELSFACEISGQEPSPSNFYPHHLGDTWQYAFYEPSTGRRDTSLYRIVADSVLANGSIYVKFEMTIGGFTSYQKYLVDSLNQVFAIGYLDTADTAKIYDLGGPIGAWWRPSPDFSGISMTVDTIYEATVFDTPATVKVFNFWFVADNDSFLFSQDFLASGFGLVQTNVYETDFNTTYLIGAILDGVRYGTLTHVLDNVSTSQASYELLQNYPNPFNAGTVIRFFLSQSGDVDLTIYDLLGQKIRTLVDQTLSAGEHSVIWDGKDDEGLPVSSGVYLYRLAAAASETEEAKVFFETRKMVVVK